MVAVYEAAMNFKSLLFAQKPFSGFLSHFFVIFLNFTLKISIRSVCNFGSILIKIVYYS